jgi:hypothetical protein
MDLIQGLPRCKRLRRGAFCLPLTSSCEDARVVLLEGLPSGSLNAKEEVVIRSFRRKLHVSMFEIKSVEEGTFARIVDAWNQSLAQTF